ncbi:MAG: ATP-binding protein [Candidatus Acidiferrales bacterium]
MRAKLFWKLGLTYLFLLLAALVIVDFYAARILRKDYLNSAEAQLASLEKLAQSRPPQIDNIPALREWAAWMSESGARVTVIASDGLVLADSAEDPATVENDSGGPEVQQAFASGEGESVRRSATLNRDLVYRAVRYLPPAGLPVVIRMAVPLAELNESLAAVRRRLVAISLLILILGGGASLIFSRSLAARIDRLKDFSRRVAAGDFRPLPREDAEDEVTDLARALNQTAVRLDGTIHSLIEERNRSSAILRSMSEGVAVIDAKERVIFCNRAFAEILNLDAARCEGKPLLELVRQVELLDLARRALQGGDNLAGDLTLGTVSPRSFAITAAPISALEPSPNGAGQSSEAQSSAAAGTLPTTAPQGSPQTAAPAAGSAASPELRHGAVVVLHDITELRRLERVRQDFVANVSHEFKTPLTAIQGFAETLLGGALEDEKNNRRFLEIIRDHAMRLSRLTDDLLKLARIEAGKLEVQFQAVPLAELIEGCAATTLLKASHRSLSLDIDYPPQLPAVRGDAGLLREVLQNLLDNAVQYTPPGGRVELRAEARANEAVITVADSGIGIPLADQERIFERFYRVDAARSREVGGTGLGLSIAKHIVEAHGGRMWVESTVGQGSQFHFSIPLAT